MGRCLLLLRGLIVFGCLAVSLPPSRAAEANAPTVNHLTVELRDGSRVVGDSDLPAVTIDTEMTGTIKVPLSKIAALQIGSNNTASVVLLRNGDRLKGTVQGGALRLNTSIGKLMIPVEVISKFTVWAAGNGPSVLTEGLVLYYSFDADDGDTVKDLSGHGHDGRVFGAKHVTDGVMGGAGQFNGRDAYIRVPTAPDLQSRKFTASAWVNARVTFDSQMGIISKIKGGVVTSNFNLQGRRRQIGVGLGGGKRGQGFDAGGDERLVVGRWGMVTLTYDGEIAAMYLNGQLVEKGEVAGYHGNAYDLLIGASEWQSSANAPTLFWNGLIDEVRIYNRALSTDEVQALYENGAATTPAPADGHDAR